MASLREGIWILPLRGRVEGLRRLIGAVRVTEPAVRVLALVDAGDPDMGKLLAELAQTDWELAVCAGDMTTVEKINFAVRLRPGERFYGLLASDIVPQTAGWGEALAAAVPDWGLSFCDDSIHGRRLPTHPVVSGNIVRALGWWAYPPAKHNGVDVYLRDLCYEFDGCEYVEGVEFLHLHPCVGRVETDEVYARAQEWMQQDRRANDQWLEEGFEAAKVRVRNARGD